jgi:hypothetical protein
MNEFRLQTLIQIKDCYLSAHPAGEFLRIMVDHHNTRVQSRMAALTNDERIDDSSDISFIPDNSSIPIVKNGTTIDEDEDFEIHVQKEDVIYSDEFEC